MNRRPIPILTAAGLMICLFALLEGCSMSISRNLPERKYYVLEAVRSGPEHAALPGIALKVARARMSPAYGGKELVYRTGRLGWESDFYNQWFVLPSEMLAAQARDWLRASGLFEHVLDTGSHLEASHILESNATSLHGDFRRTPQAVIEMQFFIIEDDSGITDVVFKKDYRQTVAIPAASAEALVAGWNEGLGKILAAFEQDLKNSLLESRAKDMD